MIEEDPDIQALMTALDEMSDEQVHLFSELDAEIDVSENGRMILQLVRSDLGNDQIASILRADKAMRHRLRSGSTLPS